MANPNKGKRESQETPNTEENETPNTDESAD